MMKIFLVAVIVVSAINLEPTNSIPVVISHQSLVFLLDKVGLNYNTFEYGAKFLSYLLGYSDGVAPRLISNLVSLLVCTYLLVARKPKEALERFGTMVRYMFISERSERETKTADLCREFSEENEPVKILAGVLSWNMKIGFFAILMLFSFGVASNTFFLSRQAQTASSMVKGKIDLLLTQIQMGSVPTHASVIQRDIEAFSEHMESMLAERELINKIVKAVDYVDRNTIVSRVEPSYMQLWDSAKTVYVDYNERGKFRNYSLPMVDDYYYYAYLLAITYLEINAQGVVDDEERTKWVTELMASASKAIKIRDDLAGLRVAERRMAILLQANAVCNYDRWSSNGRVIGSMEFVANGFETLSRSLFFSEDRSRAMYNSSLVRALVPGALGTMGLSGSDTTAQDEYDSIRKDRKTFAKLIQEYEDRANIARVMFPENVFVYLDRAMVYEGVIKFLIWRERLGYNGADIEMMYSFTHRNWCPDSNYPEVEIAVNGNMAEYVSQVILALRCEEFFAIKQAIALCNDCNIWNSILTNKNVFDGYFWDLNVPGRDLAVTEAIKIIGLPSRPLFEGSEL